MNIKKIFKFGIKLLLGFSMTRRRVSIYKTLLFNATAFGWKGIFKLPIFIYTGTKLYEIGKIQINAPMRRGMIKIGLLDHKSQGCTKFLNNGTIIFNGYTQICGCTIIENTGEITLGDRVRIGDGCTIIIRERLSIGENTRIAFQCFVMDSDDHFTIDVDNQTVSRFSRPIILGKYNWIGNRSYIKKGCKTPDYLIVASANALLTKDYSSFPPYSVIGGAPAKLLKSGIRRIYNHKHELSLIKFFTENPQENTYKFTNESINNICSQQGNDF